MEIDLNTKCRVCLGDATEMHYLFNEFDQGLTLKDVLTNTTGFKIAEDDGFSAYVCEDCTTVIVDFFNLKTVYEENNKQIKNLLRNAQNLMGNESIKTEEDILTENRQNRVESESEESCIMIKIESCSSDDVHGEEVYLEDNGKSDDDLEDDQGKENAENKYEYQEINTFSCPECGDCFLYKDDIQAHLISKHEITTINFDELSERSLLKVEKHENFANKCKVCNQSFEEVEEYKLHLETHKKNVCDVCGVGFIKKSYLKDHKEIHCNERRYVCNFCNKAFQRRTVLVKHKRIHTHPRQCICEVCGKAFNDRGTLKTHIMLLHVRERNYKCMICGVKFPLKGTLEKHVRRHQNRDREFFCTQCPLGYRDKSSLDRHIYVKHSGRNVKSTCADCGKQYTTSGNLSKHQKICRAGTLQTIEEKYILSV